MQVVEWFRGLRGGHINVESDERTGSLTPNKSGEVITHVHDLVRAERRLIIREVAEELKFSSGLYQAF
jgi:ABC-type histidine transport system ATPase subunit